MPAHLLLMFGVLPLWLVAGALDWALHRNASIETTSGTRESVLHLLMLAELGLPVLAVLWLEVDAAVLALCAVGFVLHELTVYVDLTYSGGRRNISPLEQMVHSAQEMLPLEWWRAGSRSHRPQPRIAAAGPDRPRQRDRLGRLR